MRVPLRWLAEYIDLPTDDPGEIAHALDMLGHGVESVEAVEAGWTGVVIGKVETVESHPDADQVRVTHVDVGTGELQQIICGAWNFAAGAVVPVALPGAVLPGDFTIGRRTIRGVVSNGMICSEKELGLGEDQGGIMVLDPAAPVGEPFAAVLDLPDTVIDLDITNNRPDVMSMVGVARELAAWYGVPYRQPAVTLATVPGEPSTEITIWAPDGCNRFTAREVRGAAVDQSPLWMRERLRRAGVRAISTVVDVTNYVMLELGHPLHAFDADTIAGDRLDIRWAADGETLTTLDGTDRTLTPDDLVISDADGPTSLAAVMGGLRSEVTAGTTRVLMEAASWHPATVMYASRRHELRSEASARFERGVDPALAPLANDRACALLAEIAGGEVLAGITDVVANPARPAPVTLPLDEVNRLLGGGFTVDDVAAKLRSLELDVAVAGDVLTVVVPTRRPDLTRPADLVEEVARLADYDTFPELLPTGPAGGLTPEQARLRRLHEALRGIGLSQAMNLPFVPAEDLVRFADADAAPVVGVRNPLRDDQSELRQTLLPGLLANVRDNLNRGSGAVAVFETGRVFSGVPWADDPRVPDQPMRLGIALAGPTGPRRLGVAPQVADAATMNAVVAALAVALGLTIEREAAAAPGLHPTRSARLTLNGSPVGFAGELHPDTAAAFGIDARVAVAELDLAPLLAPRPHRQAVTPSTFPHVDFDLSFDLPDGVDAAEVVAATAAAAAWVERADVFDEYTGEGRRSVAVRYRLRAPDRTLGSDDIATQRRAMIGAAAALGGVLRGAETPEGP